MLVQGPVVLEVFVTDTLVLSWVVPSVGIFEGTLVSDWGHLLDGEREALLKGEAY